MPLLVFGGVNSPVLTGMTRQAGSEAHKSWRLSRWSEGQRFHGGVKFRYRSDDFPNPSWLDHI
jgi:hypothetical protein